MPLDLTQSLATNDISSLSGQPLVWNGKNVLYIGITVTLYFHHPYVEKINEKLCQCMDEYLRLAPVPPKLVGLPNGRQWVDLTRKKSLTPVEAVSKLKSDSAWDVVYVWTGSDEEASPWYLEANRGSAGRAWALSYFHVTFPMDWAANPVVREMVRTWSERLDAYHGYAGVSLLMPPDQITQGQLDTIVYEAARRYPGLNVDYPASQSAPLLQGIKTVDWLTVLGKPFVDKLGGLSLLHPKLTPEFGLTPLASRGLLIQAGQTPQLRDAVTGKGPKLYVDLNRVLRSVRVVDYPYSFQRGEAFQSGKVDEPYMDRDAARAWIARLDD